MEIDFGVGQTIQYGGVDGRGAFFPALNDVVFPQTIRGGAHRTGTRAISRSCRGTAALQRPSGSPDRDEAPERAGSLDLTANGNVLDMVTAHT